MRPITFFWISAYLLALVPSAYADSSLQYQFQGHQGVQPILVRGGKVLIQGLDTRDRKDLLFDQQRGEATLIDHNKATFITVNEQAVDRINRQSEPLKPLIAGLGEQLSKLSPQQRAKWQDMLGGVDLDRLAAAATTGSPARVTKQDGARQVSGYSCESVLISRGKKKLAEVCMSQAEKLGLPAEDYATLRSFLDFAEHLVEKTNGLSSLMGVSLPVVAVKDLPGVPVEIRDLSSKRHETLSLAGIQQADLAAVAMEVPANYRSEPLKLW